MKRCTHELAPLCPRPEGQTARLMHLFCPYPDYLVCVRCGRIGWHTKYAHKLSWLSSEVAASVRAKADQWNAELTAKAQEQ